MSGDSVIRPLVLVNDRPEEATASHPLNPDSEMHWTSLGDVSGMERIGVHLIRLAPGKESCVPHTHATEEEFLYILSGRGMAEIDGNHHEVGPGDFMGFRTPSVAHHLRNPFDEDLVYLVGGERREVEIGQFPTLGKHLFRVGREVYMVASEHVEHLVTIED